MVEQVAEQLLLQQQAAGALAGSHHTPLPATHLSVQQSNNANALAVQLRMCGDVFLPVLRCAVLVYLKHMLLCYLICYKLCHTDAV